MILLSLMIILHCLQTHIDTIKQNLKHLNGERSYMNKCPVCGEQSEVTCKCPASESDMVK